MGEMLCDYFSLRIIYRVGHTLCGSFFIFEVYSNNFYSLRSTFLGHLCMHMYMSTHIHISSATFCQQQTAEIFTIRVFLIKDFKDLINVRSTQLPHILLFAELFPQWRKGCFPAYCLFTLPVPRTSLHTSIPHYPILSVSLHLSHM